MKTHLPKVNLDQRKWHVIDADGAVLGRLAVQVADVLRSKNKPIYTAHLDAGDFVVVINAEKVRLTGKKENAKKYIADASSKTGHIAVDAPPGAEIVIDGKKWNAVAPFKEPLDTLPGRHVLDARLGERTASRDVDAPAGVVVEVDLRFERRRRRESWVFPRLYEGLRGGEDVRACPLVK